jgi:hypothetical protein
MDRRVSRTHEGPNRWGLRRPRRPPGRQSSWFGADASGGERLQSEDPRLPLRISGSPIAIRRRRRSDRNPSEPPGTDPYAGWCGGRGGKPPRLPDSASVQFYEQCSQGVAASSFPVHLMPDLGQRQIAYVADPAAAAIAIATPTQRIPENPPRQVKVKTPNI